MPALIALLLLLALWLFWQARRRRKQAGIPGGRIIASDTRAWGRPDRPLYDAALGLTGRPDYLVQQGDVVIPVEVKSRRIRGAPYDSHIFQLAAYCLLVERSTGRRPPYGILHYPNATFAVDYTPELEQALLDLLADMRRDETRREVARSHARPARCAACGYRQRCDQRL